MCVALLRPTSQSCGAAETVAVLNMRALVARLAQARESNLRERQLKKLTLLCLLPFQFLRSQTPGMETDLVKAMAAVVVTKRVVCLAHLSVLAFPSSQSATAPRLVRRYRRKSDAAQSIPAHQST